MKWISNNAPLTIKSWDNIQQIIINKSCNKEYFDRLKLETIFTDGLINSDGIDLYISLIVLDDILQNGKYCKINHSTIINEAKSIVTEKDWNIMFDRYEFSLTKKKILYE
jgi:hypothetical protein